MAPASYGFLESGRVDFCAKHAVGVGMVNLLDHRWGPDQDCKDSILVCSHDFRLGAASTSVSSMQYLNVHTNLGEFCYMYRVAFSDMT